MHSRLTDGCEERGKVTIVELLWVTLLIAGAAAGTMAAHARFGFWGGVLGLPAGIGAGLMLCWTIACVLNALLPRKMPSQQGKDRHDGPRA
jgi:hypothetical protein